MCTKHCSSIWEPADHSGSTGKLRQALICHVASRYETARGLYEEVLSELAGSSELVDHVQRWLKVAIDGRPLSSRVCRDVKAHFNELRRLQFPDRPLVTLASSVSAERITALAAELSARARQGLEDIPEAVRPDLKLVVNN